MPNILNAIHKSAKKQTVKIEQTVAKDELSLEEQVFLGQKGKESSVMEEEEE